MRFRKVWLTQPVRVGLVSDTSYTVVGEDVPQNGGESAAVRAGVKGMDVVAGGFVVIRWEQRLAGEVKGGSTVVGPGMVVCGEVEEETKKVEVPAPAQKVLVVKGAASA